MDSTGIITTVAGTGTYGYSGDNGSATAAQLYYPAGVALDAAGNLYIADTANSVIRKVDPFGIITTVAGTPGTPGYSGDGSSATAAQLSYPYSVALDAAGNLYIADSNNSVIRKMDHSTGIITTVAGDGTTGYGGDGGPATTAQLGAPFDVALDAAGNLYIADYLNYRIRKVDHSTGIITTVAGDGNYAYGGDGGPASAAQLSFPAGLALDAVGNLYIADFFNNAIRKVDHSTGIITTVAGDGNYGYGGDGGPAGAAQLSYSAGVALDAVGNLYIADTENQRVRRVANGAGPVDTTAPTIAITTPADDAVYTLDQAVTADYACEDEAGGSGLASCDGPVPSGSALDTSSVGAHTFTVNAADTAGNTGTLTHNYGVLYNSSFGNNFGAPVDSLPTLNQMKAGGAVPVKFDLGGNYGLNILAAGYPTSQQVTCDTNAPVEPVEEIITTSQSGLTYDPSSGLYTYVWKTNKAWANTCRQFTLRLNDGSNHIALFQFK